MILLAILRILPRGSFEFDFLGVEVVVVDDDDDGRFFGRDVLEADFGVVDDGAGFDVESTLSLLIFFGVF